MEFKEILRLLKLKLNVFTNKELAKRLGISESTISKWIKRESIPKRYLKLLEESGENIFNSNNNNGIQSINNNGTQINGDININQLSDIELELCKLIKELDDKEKEYYYHTIKSDILKKSL
jgi:transcriptional regulator with XRE-family HTH domain